MIYNKLSSLSEGINDPDFFQKFFDALPIPIFYRDIHGVYQMCNKAHEVFSERPRSEIIGQSIFGLYSKHMAEIYHHKDLELLSNPDIQIYETRVTQKDGSHIDVVIHKAVIRNNSGKIIGIAGSINDVTTLKQTEQRLYSAQKSMEISSHMLHKINIGILMMDENHKVLDSNESFARLMDEEISDLFKTIPGLISANVKNLVPPVIYKMLTNILHSGEKILERDIKHNERLLHVNVLTLYPHKVVGAVIRDMSSPLLVRDEIISRSQRIKKQNIDTVQKIAYLLGENAAEIEELINSIVESHRYGTNQSS